MTILNILTLIACLPWFLIFMFSPMMFDAPGSMNLERLIYVMLILLYPVIFGFLYLIFGWKFFGIGTKWIAGVLIGVPIFGIWLFGYPNSAYLAWRGIPAHGYAVKEKVVYYNGNRIPADPESLVVIDDTFLAKDSRSVFQLGVVYQGKIDPQTFEKIPETRFFRDKERVFHLESYMLKELEGARPQTFKTHTFMNLFGEQVPSYYSSDAKNVFFRVELVPGLSVSNLWVKGAYAGDGTSVFFEGKKMDADPTTFQVFYPGSYKEMELLGLAKDKHAVFSNADKTSIDAGSFKLLGNYYARDAEKIYHMRDNIKIVEGADLETFQVYEDPDVHSDAKDDKNRYDYGKIIVGEPSKRYKDQK